MLAGKLFFSVVTVFIFFYTLMVNSLNHFAFDVSCIIMFRKIIHHQFRAQIKPARRQP